MMGVIDVSNGPNGHNRAQLAALADAQGHPSSSRARATPSAAASSGYHCQCQIIAVAAFVAQPSRLWVRRASCPPQQFGSLRYKTGLSGQVV